jgi:hypothetical protein
MLLQLWFTVGSRKFGWNRGPCVACQSNRTAPHSTCRNCPVAINIDFCLPPFPFCLLCHTSKNPHYVTEHWALFSRTICLCSDLDHWKHTDRVRQCVTKSISGAKIGYQSRAKTYWLNRLLCHSFGHTIYIYIYIYHRVVQVYPIIGMFFAINWDDWRLVFSAAQYMSSKVGVLRRSVEIYLREMWCERFDWIELAQGSVRW